MPQFDFTTFSSQIFWFALCFITLYLAASRLILPRITAIIAARAKIVDANKSLAHKLDSQINDLTSKTADLRQESSVSYQNKIEETLKKSAKERDKTIEDLKEKIEEMNKKSRNELKEFLENSKTQSLAAINDLVQKIKTKILN
jgi:F-type H+-transporting ATPase subunit b